MLQITLQMIQWNLLGNSTAKQFHVGIDIANHIIQSDETTKKNKLK